MTTKIDKSKNVKEYFSLEELYEYFKKEYGYIYSNRQLKNLTCVFYEYNFSFDVMDDIEVQGNTVYIGNNIYVILTDEEANEEAKRYILDYLYEILASEKLKDLYEFIDHDKYVEHMTDNYRSRGQWISFYDGSEISVLFNDTWYNIYRTK